LHRARLPALVVLTGIFVTAVELWVFDVEQVWAGLVILGLLAGVRQWEKSLWPRNIVVSLGKYVPTAACLLGYTVAFALTSSTEPEQVGWEAACGVFGGILTLNGITKWHQGGWRWFNSQGLGLLVAERAYTTRQPIARRARRWLVANPLWCVALSGGTAVIDSVGFLFWVPALRAPLAALTFCILWGFVVFLGYFPVEFMVLVLTLAGNAG
jgi:hypothetical protein